MTIRRNNSILSQLRAVLSSSAATLTEITPRPTPQCAATCSATGRTVRCDREPGPEAHPDGAHDHWYRSANDPGVSWDVREDEDAWLPLNRQRAGF